MNDTRFLSVRTEKGFREALSACNHSKCVQYEYRQVLQQGRQSSRVTGPAF